MRTSTDVEDLVYVLDNRKEVLNEVASSDESLRRYLRREFQLLLDDPSIDEGITSALPYGSGSLRVTKIKDIMQTLADG